MLLKKIGHEISDILRPNKLGVPCSFLEISPNSEKNRSKDKLRVVEFVFPRQHHLQSVKFSK
jgi:hypothetical protein